MKIRRDRARWFIQSMHLHQVIGTRPVGMAIEQRADDAPIQHVRKRFVMRFGDEFRNDFVSLDEALDTQALVVCRSAAEAAAGWCVLIL